jgi:RsiW-degrading membrane proteinase PrsW (M82 family)
MSAQQKTYGCKFKMLVFIVMFLMLGVGQIVLAQGGSNNLDKPFGEKTDMASLTQTIFEFAIALCVLAAAIYIAWGSLHYFYAAGDAKKAAEGKEVISRAIIGLILALVSWIILNTIHTQFTELKINLLQDNKNQFIIS